MSAHPASGVFIAFEGGEGTGKSTQARLLFEALKADGRDVVLTREPGGTDGAEAIRTLLLDPPGEGWEPIGEAMLFAAARSDHVAKVIRPAIGKGQWVICDRYVDSSIAYQGVAGRLGSGVIEELHRIGSDGLRPDLVFLLTVDDALVMERLAARDGTLTDAIARRSATFHRAVGHAFSQLARGDAAFHTVNGNRPEQEVHAEIWSAVQRWRGRDEAC